MEEDWEGEANVRGAGVELCKPLEPQNLLPYDSVVFGNLEEEAFVHGGEREEHLGVALHYPIHLFYKVGKDHNSTILSFNFPA